MSTATLKARVSSIGHEANGVLSIELAPATDGLKFPAVDAGAHINIDLPNGLRRSYSIFNADAEAQSYQIAVLNNRPSRGGSRYIHENLRVGDMLDISHPANNFPLNEAGEKFVFVAGGIGITPIYSMLRRLHALGKKAKLIYCARSKESAAFRRELESLGENGLDVQWHFDDEQGSTPDLQRLLSLTGPEPHYYCCGPTPMLTAFESICKQYQYPHAYIERFSAEPPEAAAPDRAYKIELRKTGVELEVLPGKSILDTILEAGYDADYGCKEGLCGACESRVIDGEIDHRDSILSQAQKARGVSMLICVSGCQSERLVLDL